MCYVFFFILKILVSIIMIVNVENFVINKENFGKIAINVCIKKCFNVKI